MMSWGRDLIGINSKFTVAVHILALLDIEKDGVHTSEAIAGSVNTNAVVIRRITGMLNKAGLVSVRPGVPGAALARRAADITLYEIYKAVSGIEQDQLFKQHEAPNPACPIGRNVNKALFPWLSEAQMAMEQVLGNVTLAQVASDIVKQEQQ
jgi:DNA-binding IscR family transcriptional regulator